MIPQLHEDDFLESTVLWKVTLRLIPFLFLLYVMNILDRVNVGFARLQMLTDLHIGEEAYGFGSGIFFIGYFLFEVPSNLLLSRTGARRWMARILISWGIISASMMFVTSAWSFYLLRFLLGLAEAGFFPGIILYLSYWFPARRRAHALSRFLTGSAITGILGGPLSGAILQYLSGAAGLAGWQWLFLLEGLPSVVLGFVTLYYLTDRPEQASWLTVAERAWLAQRMSQEEEYRQQRHGFTLWQTTTDSRVWLLCMLYFTVAMGANSFGLYLPQVLADHFSTAGKFQIGLLAAVPSLVAIGGMMAVARHSDHTGERRWHVALSSFLSAIGWMMVVHSRSSWLVLVGLALAQLGTLSMLAPFWSLPTSFLSGTAAAGGIALINSIGNLGGFVGPNIIGQAKAATGRFSGGFTFLAVALVLGGFLALCARHEPGLEQQSLSTGQDGDHERWDGSRGTRFDGNSATTL
jgi:MFS transporter, ACS family, tartrate transporter